MKDDPVRPAPEPTQGSASSQRAAAEGSAAAYLSSKSERSRERRSDQFNPEEPRRPSGWIAFFGVLLPAFTMWFELKSQLCATMWFDPMPSSWHVFLLALVPLANALVIATRWWPATRFRGVLAQLNAIALGVTIAYTLAFAPYLPISAIGVMFYGMGLMPLSPLLSMLATIFARRCLPDWGKIRGEEPASLPRWWPACLAAFAALAEPVLHTGLTIELMEQTFTTDAARTQRAVRLLRWVGKESTMLEGCYDRRDGRGLFEIDMSLFHPPSGLETNRETFFRVTGEPFNSRPAPTSVRAMGRGDLSGWNFDSGLGSAQVADRVAGLKLEASRLDGKIDTTGLTSYTEWTLVFRNDGNPEAEARALLQMPAGGVVSRVTLWINGEPCEAAFGGRVQTRQAYQEVAVVQRRDPVLVTTSGLDRVLVQCFPIPAGGGTMQVRVGITAPLQPQDDRHLSLALPRIVEQNFDSGGELTHELWMESSSPFANGTQKDNRRLTDVELRDFRPLVLPWKGPVEMVAADPTDTNFALRQTVETQKTPRPSRIAFVFDGSREMKAYLASFGEALRGFPTEGVSAVFAGDDVIAWDGKGTLSDWVRRQKAVGGRDSVPALLSAWDFASAAPDGVVVWVHGPQPVLLSRLGALEQRVERDGSPPTWYDLPTRPAANRLLTELDAFPRIRRVPDAATPAESLRALLDRWAGKREDYVIHRERVPRVNATALTTADEGHVARLWGREEIDRLRLDRAASPDAMKLALQLHLVTPVSGAVVLERKEQYDRHGLKPSDPAEMPTIPEPTTGALLAIAVVCFGCRRFRPLRAIHD
jgi:hypothetical protein